MGGLKLRIGYKRKLRNLQITHDFEPDDYIWCDLGQTQIGVSNDEGYSKEFIAIGSEIPLVNSITKINGKAHNRIDIVRFTEKFYYTNSQTPHHVDEQYLVWSGNLIDYIDRKRRKLWH